MDHESPWKMPLRMVAGLDTMPYIRKSQKWLVENFYNFTSPNVWPPNYPDLNLIDYYVWGMIEREANKSTCSSKGK